MKTPEEVAKELGITIETVRRWIREGKLPAIKIGKQWRIEEETLEAIKNKQIKIT